MLDRHECFQFLITCKRTNNANNATDKVKLSKKRWKSSKRNYYIISPRVTVKAIIIITRAYQDPAEEWRGYWGHELDMKRVSTSVLKKDKLQNNIKTKISNNNMFANQLFLEKPLSALSNCRANLRARIEQIIIFFYNISADVNLKHSAPRLFLDCCYSLTSMGWLRLVGSFKL